MQDATTLQCDMTAGCTEPVAMIDNSGFIYCERHGRHRRTFRPCRKLRPHELNRLRRGQQVTHY